MNDQYGHAAGDALLKAFAERLSKSTRGSDLAARYGGDEFLAIVPDCRPQDVQFILKRLDGLRVDVLAAEWLPDFLLRGMGELYSGGIVRRFTKAHRCEFIRQQARIEIDNPLAAQRWASTGIPTEWRFAKTRSMAEDAVLSELFSVCSPH